MGIELHNLRLAYGDRVLMDQVTASIPGSRLTALVGRNGTGKSTLLRAITGLNDRYSGEILLNGRRLKNLAPRERAATVSFVATDKIRIANLLCEDAVALGRAPYTNWIGRMQEADREIVARSLDLVGMGGFARKPMNTLSDGECQRVLIARALAQDTPVILLDEPTAFLDLPNRYILCSLLGRLAHEQHKCILFSTHDLDIALNLCDEVALIDTPQLHLLPARRMAESGHIERLFAGEGLSAEALDGMFRLLKR